MQDQICEFYLSHHFMLRGWDRTIDNGILYKVLPEVTISHEQKKLAIVTPSFLEQRGIAKATGRCLVIVLTQKLIKTAFWCKDPNYLHRKEKQADIQWIYD